MTDLPVDDLSGCIVVSSAAMDKLDEADQAAVREASAMLMVRIDALGRRRDDQLLGGVFQRQGIKSIKASAKLKAEFFAAARAARAELSEDLVPKDLLQRVLEHLADYRAEHPRRRPKSRPNRKNPPIIRPAWVSGSCAWSWR